MSEDFNDFFDGDESFYSWDYEGVGSMGRRGRKPFMGRKPSPAMKQYTQKQKALMKMARLPDNAFRQQLYRLPAGDRLEVIGIRRRMQAKMYGLGDVLIPTYEGLGDVLIPTYEGLGQNDGYSYVFQPDAWRIQNPASFNDLGWSPFKKVKKAINKQRKAFTKAALITVAKLPTNSWKYKTVWKTLTPNEKKVVLAYKKSLRKKSAAKSNRKAVAKSTRKAVFPKKKVASAAKRNRKAVAKSTRKARNKNKKAYFEKYKKQLNNYRQKAAIAKKTFYHWRTMYLKTRSPTYQKKMKEASASFHKYNNATKKAQVMMNRYR